MVFHVPNDSNDTEKFICTCPTVKGKMWSNYKNYLSRSLGSLMLKSCTIIIQKDIEETTKHLYRGKIRKFLSLGKRKQWIELYKNVYGY